MMRAIAMAGLLALAACGATPGEAPRSERSSLEGALLSRTVALPEDEARFPEPAGALLNRNCLSCHSADMVLYQPRLTDAQWRAAIEKMRDTFHAPIPDADIEGLVAELVALSPQR